MASKTGWPPRRQKFGESARCGGFFLYRPYQMLMEKIRAQDMDLVLDTGEENSSQ